MTICDVPKAIYDFNLWSTTRVDRVVLSSRNGQIRECYQNAVDCAKEAAAQTDPQIKQDFLDLIRGWLLLARSYESERRLITSDTTSQEAPRLRPPSHFG
jgi:hypothetical protein